MLSATEKTAGVGNNEYPFPMVRGTKAGSGKHFPFRIVPDVGQVLQNVLNAAGEQPADVFNDGVLWADLADEAHVLIPQ